MSLPSRLQKFEEKLEERAEIHKEAHWIKRMIWVAGGFLALGAGLLMLVLPGPGILFIAIGLGMLALEFAWADWLLRRGIRSGMRIGELVTLRRVVFVALFLGAAFVLIFCLLL